MPTARFWPAARRILAILACALSAAPLTSLLGAYWIARGKRVRGKNLIFSAAAKAPDFYRRWIAIREPTEFVRLRPTFPVADGFRIFAAVATDSAEDEVHISEARQALMASLGQYLLEILVIRTTHLEADLARARQMLYSASGDNWLLLVGVHDRLSPFAGEYAARAASADPSPAIIFWDEDLLIDGARCQPRHKTAWDEMLCLGRDLLRSASVIKISAALTILDAVSRHAGASWRDAFYVAAAAHTRAAQFVHVPLILTHVGKQSRADFDARASQVRASWPYPMDLAPHPTAKGWQIPIPPLPARLPDVSIIIPTRDQVQLLKACVDGCISTRYPRDRIEILVIDNNSVKQATLDYLTALERSGVKVIGYPGAFNFAKMNNAAVDAASGRVLCFMNNDIEIQDDGWLERLVRFVCLPGVGAVGPALTYPGGQTQHAGVALGIGGAAGHTYRLTPRSEVGVGDMHRVVRRTSALTAACLLVKRENFQCVGGFDEERFPVAFNDVDLCLKLGRLGLQNLLIGDVELIHHESISRGDDSAPENAARFAKELTALRERWGTEVVSDPYWPPLYRRSSEQAILAL